MPFTTVELGLTLPSKGGFFFDNLSFDSDQQPARSQCIGGPPTCEPVARSGCQASAPAKSTVKLSSGTSVEKNKPQSKWVGGAAVALADFGSPTSTTGYALCVYAGTGLESYVSIPAGGMCGKRPCWSLNSTGAKYGVKDARKSSVKVSLKSGGAGKAAIKVKAAGSPEIVPGMSLVTPVVVQLQRSDASDCWEAQFGTALDNTSTLFKAKSDNAGP